MKRLGVFLLVVLVIAVGGGVWYFLNNYAPILKTQIETYGSAATGTSVRLDSVSIGYTKAAAVLNNLRIANPEGYADGDALAAGQISATVDLTTIAGNKPLIIRELIIEKPALIYEGNGLKSNLSTIQDHVEQYAKSLQAQGDQASANTSQPTRKIIIRDLYVRDGTVTINNKDLEKPLVAELGEIHVRNIGSLSGGASYAEVTKSVLGAVMGAAARKAVEQLVVKTGPIGGAIEGINNLLGGDGDGGN